MRTFGKLLQVAGLVILPMACFQELLGGLGRSSGLAVMNLLMICGALAFILGRYMEGYGAPASR